MIQQFSEQPAVPDISLSSFVLHSRGFCDPSDELHARHLVRSEPRFSLGNPGQAVGQYLVAVGPDQACLQQPVEFLVKVAAELVALTGTAGGIDGSR